MTLAHGVCAAAEGVGSAEEARLARRAAVSVPSLVAEALFEARGAGAEEALARAASQIGELRSLLEAWPASSKVPEPERLSLLADAALLSEELEEAGRLLVERA